MTKVKPHLLARQQDLLACDISTGRHRYLDLEGNVPNNFITERGTQQGRSNADYNRVTHFRILKREEM